MKVKEMLIKVSKPFCSEKQDANGDSEIGKTHNNCQILTGNIMILIL